MGCTKSKLDDDVCLKDETSDLHTKYIDKHGLQSYYNVMGMPPQGPSGSETNDSSENFNLGFVNIEEKTTVDNKFYGLSVSDISKTKDTENLKPKNYENKYDTILQEAKSIVKN